MIKNTITTLLTTLVISLLLFGAANIVSASPSNAPRDDFYIANGTVYSSVLSADNSTLYIGGNFDYVGPNTGHGVAVDINTGLYNPDFPLVNGPIFTTISDGSGGWYIGGDFTKVGSYTRNNIAHILSDGLVDSTWNPNANSSVKVLLINGPTLYAGGQFSSIGGQTRNSIAALNVSTGLATDWNPDVQGGDGFWWSRAVYSLATSGSILYVGGQFSSIGGQNRNSLAALDINTGLATDWNPSTTYSAGRFTWPGIINALELSGSNIYIGGQITSVGGEMRSGVASIARDSGVPTSWNPGCGGSVKTLKIIDSTIYVGGIFSSISEQNRNNIAALDINTGLATEWDPNADGSVNSLAVNGSTVYVVGNFQNIGGQVRNYIAALNTSNGLTKNWNPSANYYASSLAISGSVIYVGGSFISVGGQIRNNAAALNTATGIVTNWNPSANGRIDTLAVSDSTIYAGGVFTSIGGQSRNGIAALNNSNGLATTWDPAPSSNTISDVSIKKLLVRDSLVYVGGYFTSIGGQDRSSIAALNITTGLATGWDPNAINADLGLIPGGAILTLDINNSLVYVGGQFTDIGGQTRNNIAALDINTGLATEWDPSAQRKVGELTSSDVETLIVNGSNVYVGGHFTVIGGQDRNYVAALNIDTGLATGWDPGADGNIYALAINDSTIYVGGEFLSIGGQSRAFSAAIDATTGLANAWDTNSNAAIRTFAIGESNIYVGGTFQTINNQSCSGLAVFDLAPPANPSDITADNINTNSINLSWLDNSNNENLFNIYISTDGVTYTNIGTTRANHTSVAINDLSPNTRYWFKVAAVNGVGASYSTPPTGVYTIALPSNNMPFIPVGVGSGVLDKAIGMGKTGYLGTIDKLGINLLAYITSKGIFKTLVSHNYELEEHNIVIDRLDLSSNNLVSFTIKSNPQVLSLKLGDTVEVDLDNDRVNDISIKFANIWINRVELTIKSLLSTKEAKVENNKLTPSTTNKIIKFIFRKNLKLGNISNDVKELQKYLNNNNFIITKLGLGSKGKETTYFGLATKNSLIKFQKSKKIIPANGLFGPLTRNVVNK